jgi:SAM-dependent methyltransferase
VIFAIHCNRCETAAALLRRISWDCPACEHRMPIEGGVIWSAPGPPPPPSAIAARAAEVGWLAAAEEALKARGLGPRALMTRLNGIRTERLGDWQFLVEPDPEGAALILGDSWGTHMATASRFMRQVVVFVQDGSAARILALRAAQEGLSNVAAIVCGRGVQDFPFRREQFGLIAVVGPWRRESPGPGEERPLDGLIRAAYRFLHKGGAFVLGFPNRLGLRAPRPTAPGGDRSGGWIGATAASSRNRIIRAGFQDPQLYLPFPDFTDYSALVSLDSRKALRYFHGTYRHPRARWKRVLIGAAIDSGLLPLVAPSYIATAKKP